MFLKSAYSSHHYQNLAVETALADSNPHQLIALLFSGALEAIAQARSALAKDDICGRGKSVNRAIKILDNGLRHSLNLKSSSLAQDLDRLYDYMIRRLSSAHRHANDFMLAEVSELLSGLSSAWNDIAPQVQSVQAAR